MDHSRTLNVLLFIIVIIAVGVALKLMQPVLTLFLVALMLAYLIDPVMVVGCATMASASIATQ